MVFIFRLHWPLVINLVFVLSCVWATSILNGSTSSGDWTTNRSPGCWQTSRLKGNIERNEVSRSFDRIVVVGDVHGCLTGLLEVLQKAKVLAEHVPPDVGCIWRNQVEEGSEGRVLLIQTGDMVDRGKFSLECINCLRQLQSSAPKYSSQVIRLLGNHDLMWLSGAQYDEYRNKEVDTPQRIHTVAKQMIKDILDHKLMGAFSIVSFQDIPIFFSHAGLRQRMKDHLQARIVGNSLQSGAELAARLADAVNKVVLKDIERCKKNYPRFNQPSFNATIFCNFKGDIYTAGPDRGGSEQEIGGVFWTDYSVLTKEAAAIRRRLINGDSLDADQQVEINRSIAASAVDDTLWPFAQVVGHTMVTSRVRSVEGVLSVCIDVGIVMGGRGYLEIKPSGRFISHVKNLKTKKWEVDDLMERYCPK